MLLGRVAVVLLVFGAAVAAAELAPPERSYNFLMLLPVSSKSHRSVFMPLALALTERGHKVTMLCNHPPTSDKHPNLLQYEHGLPYMREDKMDVFSSRKNISLRFALLNDAVAGMVKEIYSVPVVKELYQRRKEFDLIIVDALFNEIMYPFVHERSFITIATAGLEVRQSAHLGNVIHPAAVCTRLQEFPLPLSFVNRVKNIAFLIASHFIRRYYVILPYVQPEISKQFPDLPPLLEIERNESLVLMNSHFSMSPPVPLLPAQVEIGGIHCRPGKPLPKDLLEFISGTEDVVYFSLGSVVRSSALPSKFKKLFISAFSRLPYKIIWKFEEDLPDTPRNVLIKDWMPQQDVLAHPNVKLFISHGGALGTQEAMYHGKPVLVLPVFGDQTRNGIQLQDAGMGRVFDWDELTEDILVDAITDMVTSPSYMNKASKVSTILRDQPQRPVDRAVFWTEYVVRHQGAVHLRSPQRDLSWVQFLNLDVIAAVLMILFMIYSLGMKLCCACAGLCRRGGNVNANTNKSKTFSEKSQETKTKYNKLNTDSKEMKTDSIAKSDSKNAKTGRKSTKITPKNPSKSKIESQKTKAGSITKMKESTTPNTQRHKKQLKKPKNKKE